MNVLKRSTFLSLFAFMALPTVQAEEVTTLPTIRVMAESELREEVGPVPFQEDMKVRQALQHRIYKTHSDMQNEPIKESTVTVDYQPKVDDPDPSQIPLTLQPYNIFAVAAGFQSSDPTNGFYQPNMTIFTKIKHNQSQTWILSLVQILNHGDRLSEPY